MCSAVPGSQSLTAGQLGSWEGVPGSPLPRWKYAEFFQLQRPEHKAESICSIRLASGCSHKWMLRLDQFENNGVVPTGLVCAALRSNPTFPDFCAFAVYRCTNKKYFTRRVDCDSVMVEQYLLTPRLTLPSPRAWPRTTPPILSRGALEATGLDQAARFIEDTYTLSAVTSSESNPTTRGQPPLGREGEEAALRREAPLGMKGGLQESVLIGVTEGQREGGVGNKPGGSVEPVTQSGGVEGGEGRGYPKVVSVGSMSAARDPVKGDLKDLLTRMSDSRVIALTQKLSAARRDGDETEIRLLTEQLERALEGAGT
ncbi:acrosin-binding protein-like isoform X2 [Polyodon spathula]|uniref:acrosin-binding protein-like isoform X2 n=1 Tax=Polyodon spathula TaxID=7913 RepID=UPI001B7E0F4B|nr:acrosin-binding protein-like isoform X2 [Polyodon spathula]XP_041123875.1 acrosin-binding protein-like isoform X2 [Polyodon spathula]